MKRRTTVVAEADDLALLADEAKRQGQSLGDALGALVAQRAAVLREPRRPHLGVFSSGKLRKKDDDAVDGYHPELRRA